MVSTENMTSLEELMTLLGYIDPRAVIKWCGRNEIPIIKLGLKKYISSQLLTQIIDNQLVIFVKRVEKTVQDNFVFKPTNEIISKYQEKYESASKTKTPRK